MESAPNSRADLILTIVKAILRLAGVQINYRRQISCEPWLSKEALRTPEAETSTSLSEHDRHVQHRSDVDNIQR